MSNTFLTYSSITKKIVMASAGLFLAVFLLVHLSINLTLLRDDGGKWFNDASHFISPYISPCNCPDHNLLFFN